MNDWDENYRNRLKRREEIEAWHAEQQRLHDGLTAEPVIVATEIVDKGITGTPISDDEVPAEPVDPTPPSEPELPVDPPADPAGDEPDGEPSGDGSGEDEPEPEVTKPVKKAAAKKAASADA